MTAKIINASEAYAIYEESFKKKNLMLWETHAPKLDRIIREQSKNGHTSVILDLRTWQPMVGYIEALGYNVTWNFDSDHREIAGLTVDWSKS